MTRPTKAAFHIGSHIGMDYEDLENDCRYQSTRWTRPVYAVGQTYWCVGRKPAEYIGSPFFTGDEGWSKVISDYDGKTILWFYEA